MIAKLGLVLALLSGTIFFGMRPAPAPKRELKIAVVNMRQCFEKYDRVKEVEGEIKKLREEMETKIKATQKQMDEIQVKLSAFKPGSPNYWRYLDEFQSLESGLKAQREAGQRYLLNRTAWFQIEVYNDITKAIAKFDETQHFDLILKGDEPRLAQEEDLRSLLLAAQIQVVFRHSAALDITNDVVKILNEKK